MPIKRHFAISHVATQPVGTLGLSVRVFQGYPDAQTERPYTWVGIVPSDDAQYF